MHDTGHALLLLGVAVKAKGGAKGLDVGTVGAGKLHELKLFLCKSHDDVSVGRHPRDGDLKVAERVRHAKGSLGLDDGTGTAIKGDRVCVEMKVLSRDPSSKAASLLLPRVVEILFEPLQILHRRRLSDRS